MRRVVNTKRAGHVDDVELIPDLCARLEVRHYRFTFRKSVFDFTQRDSKTSLIAL